MWWSDGFQEFLPIRPLVLLLPTLLVAWEAYLLSDFRNSMAWNRTHQIAVFERLKNARKVSSIMRAIRAKAVP